MTTDPSIMLRQLGQTGRIAAPISAPATPSNTSGVQAGEFADLLKRARDGTLASNRPVTLDSDSGLQLSEDQLGRLALAADRAEAAGLRTALVTIDDQRVILDVQSRTVKGASGSDGGIVEGIDGVIDLAGVLAPSAATAVPIGPPGALENASVARLLATMRERAA